MFTSLSGLLVIAAIGQGLQLPKLPPASMSLTVMCEGAADHRRLRFTIKNPGTEGARVFLGYVLVSRSLHLVEGLMLLVKQNPGDREERYQYQPGHFLYESPVPLPPAMGYWLEFLPIAKSYTTVADFSDFERRLVIPKVAKLSLEWQIYAPPPHVPGAGEFWTGTLRSNEVRFPEQCKP